MATDQSLTVYNEQEISVVLVPADTSTERVIEMWLHGKPATTIRSYRPTANQFLQFIGGKSLHAVLLSDLQGYIDSLEGKPSTIAHHISVIKSLFSFCYKTGYMPINKGATIQAPKFEQRLAERILTEEQVQKMLALEPDPRNHAILRLLYNSGCRCSELINLSWIDIYPNGKGGKIRVWGKGGKERYIIISAPTYEEIMALRGESTDQEPVFCSKTLGKGGRISRSQVYRIVRAAANRALNKNASPHFIRHSHASHSLNRKAPWQLVRDTMGHASMATLNKYSHADPGESSGEYLPI